MTFGESLNLLFEAHRRDIISSNTPDTITRYTNAELKAAFATWANNPRWRLALQREFEVLSSTLEREILSCKHGNVKQKYNWMQECPDCLCMRTEEREDPDPNSYNERMIWGKWRLGMLT